MSTTENTAKLREAWTGEATYATTLLCLLIDTYGTEPLGDNDEREPWSPETIQMEIEDDFQIKLPPDNFDKLMAAIALLTTDDFYWSLPDFIRLCNVLNGDGGDDDLWDPADAAEIAWGVTEAVMLNPPEGEEPFTDEIRGYIGAVLDAEGIIRPPDLLRLALRGDPESKINGDFSDDPVMFASIYKFEEGKTSAINEYVRNNLRLLAAQLEALPLRVGTTKGVVAAVLRSLSPSEKKAAPTGTIEL